MTDLEQKLAKQLAEWEPTDVRVDPYDRSLVTFKAFGRTDMWARLTPKKQDVMKGKVYRGWY